MLPTNLAFLRIAKRAEQQDEEVLQNTFVDFGSILTVVTSMDHQIIYGRRGTGKTHLLTKVRQLRKGANEAAVQIDMRNLGSAGGIYADHSIPLPERATRLLVDVLSTLHGQLQQLALDGDSLNLGIVGTALDELFDAHSSVRVVGETTIEDSVLAEQSVGSDAKLGATVAGVPSLTGNIGSSNSAKDAVTAKRTIKGKEILRVNFGRVGTALRNVVTNLPKSAFGF